VTPGGFEGFGWCWTSDTSCPGVVGDVSVRLYSPVHPNGQHRFVEGGGGVPWVVGSSRCCKSSGSYLPWGRSQPSPSFSKRYSAHFAWRIGKKAYANRACVIPDATSCHREWSNSGEEQGHIASATRSSSTDARALPTAAEDAFPSDRVP